MSTLTAIKGQLAFERTKVTVAILIILAATIGAFVTVKPATPLDLVELTSTYAPVVNLVLTCFLVALTAFYAWVTHRMAAEMADARRAAIRPLFVLEASDPLVTNGPHDEPQLRATLTVWNSGRGQALATQIECDALHEGRGAPTRIQGRLAPQPPSVFSPGQQHQGAWTVYGYLTDMTQSREDFFEVWVSYQDGEGNLYQLFATYDLQVLSGKRYWRRNREALYFLPFRLRRSLREENIIGAVTQYTKLYERSFL